jgi:pSer/pThr/pTyr-binding forkhead associated (FHA) protein
MAANVTLTFVNGPLEGREFEFTRAARVVIGRARDCDVPLPTGLGFLEVSRRHCELEVGPPSARVRDLGSRNGTLVNGQRIGQRAPGPRPVQAEKSPWHSLKNGDELRLGEVVFRVGLPAPERDAAHAVTEAPAAG